MGRSSVSSVASPHYHAHPSSPPSYAEAMYPPPSSSSSFSHPLPVIRSSILIPGGPPLIRDPSLPEPNNDMVVMDIDDEDEIEQRPAAPSGEHAQQQAQEETWTCHKCTYTNTGRDSICGICDGAVRTYVLHVSSGFSIMCAVHVNIICV